MVGPMPASAFVVLSPAISRQEAGRRYKRAAATTIPTTANPGQARSSVSSASRVSCTSVTRSRTWSAAWSMLFLACVWKRLIAV